MTGPSDFADSISLFQTTCFSGSIFGAVILSGALAVTAVSAGGGCSETMSSSGESKSSSSNPPPDDPDALPNILRKRLRYLMPSRPKVTNTAVGDRPSTSAPPAVRMMNPRMENEPANAVVP